jgi:hypothetical protein
MSAVKTPPIQTSQPAYQNGGEHSQSRPLGFRFRGIDRPVARATSYRLATGVNSSVEVPDTLQIVSLISGV